MSVDTKALAAFRDFARSRGWEVHYRKEGTPWSTQWDDLSLSSDWTADDTDRRATRIDVDQIPKRSGWAKIFDALDRFKHDEIEENRKAPLYRAARRIAENRWDDSILVTMRDFGVESVVAEAKRTISNNDERHRLDTDHALNELEKVAAWDKTGELAVMLKARAL